MNSIIDQQKDNILIYELIFEDIIDKKIIENFNKEFKNFIIYGESKIIMRNGAEDL